MLRNVPDCINPALMMMMMEMGHGDELVIGDINFPQVTMGKRVAFCKGIKGPEILAAILKFLPLDIYVDDPVSVMAVGPEFKGTPPVWVEYDKIIRENDFCGAFKQFNQVERFAFYERAKNAFGVVATSEPGLYACVILKKGVIDLSKEGAKN